MRSGDLGAMIVIQPFHNEDSDWWDRERGWGNEKDEPKVVHHYDDEELINSMYI